MRLHRNSDRSGRILSGRRIGISTAAGLAAAAVTIVAGMPELAALVGWIVASGLAMAWVWRIAWPQGHEVTERLRATLGEKLIGVYLHGSAVLGDFVRERSDVDIVAVSDGPLTGDESDAVAERLSSEALPCPARGVELHVVDRAALDDLVEPPPFQLHIATPDRVIVGQGQGGDPDLVMHYAVLRVRGVALAGPPASGIFPTVSREKLVRAFAGELRWALEKNGRERWPDELPWRRPHGVCGSYERRALNG